VVNRDPKPSSEPRIELPLLTQDLEELRVRLSKMPQAELVKFYDAAIRMCQLNRGVPPSAGFIQQLVQAWKEMQRRREAAANTKAEQ
jgi:hypothetical protein